MTNFSELKKTSSTSFAKLNDQLQKLGSSSANRNQDEDSNDYWYPDVDKAGNGYAVIRFLPAPAGEDLPFVKMISHGFQGPGGWYIENSLATLGMPDPVSEYNGKLWNEDGSNAAKEQVRKQGRKTNYHCNIYVIKDPANPQNEGKVFKFKFGKKIYSKLNDVMNPQFPDEAPINPFDFWTGANFNIKIRDVEGYRNYDKSDFSSPAPLSNDDAELEAIWKSQFSLKTISDPSKFKSYDELKARLHKVLQLDGPAASSAPVHEAKPAENREMNFTPKFDKSSSEPSHSDSGWKSPETKAGGDDDDDLSAFFNSLGD